jgi:hypothetical protein
LIWSIFAKVIKELVNQKKKRERKRENRKWTRGNVSAQLHKRPMAHQETNLKGYPLSLIPPPTGGPRSSGPLLPLTDRTHRSVLFFPGLKNQSGDHVVTSSSIEVNACPFHPRATPIRSPHSPPPPPFSPSAREAARPAQFLTGARSFCRRLRLLSTESVSPSPSL